MWDLQHVYNDIHIQFLSVFWAFVCHEPDIVNTVGQFTSQTSNISGTLVGNKIVDHSDAVGAVPVGAAPTTSSFST